MKKKYNQRLKNVFFYKNEKIIHVVIFEKFEIMIYKLQIYKKKDI